MGSLHKNIQLMMEFLKGPFLLLNFTFYTLMTFPMTLSAIFLYMLMILLSTECNQTSDLLQQLELVSELESDLRDTVDQGKKWFVDFKAGKTQLASFDQSNYARTIDVKIDESVLEEKSSFKILGLSFSSKLNWGSCIISIAKTVSKKIRALFIV